jgi:hypothetical protein
LQSVAADLRNRLDREAERAEELKAQPPDHGPEIALLTRALAKRDVTISFE